MLIITSSNQVQDFRAAVAKYGAGRYAALTIGNEVNDSAGNIMNKVFDVRGEPAACRMSFLSSTYPPRLSELNWHLCTRKHRSHLGLHRTLLDVWMDYLLIRR